MLLCVCCLVYVLPHIALLAIRYLAITVRGWPYVPPYLFLRIHHYSVALYVCCSLFSATPFSRDTHCLTEHRADYLLYAHLSSLSLYILAHSTLSFYMTFLSPNVSRTFFQLPDARTSRACTSALFQFLDGSSHNEQHLLNILSTTWLPRGYPPDNFSCRFTCAPTYSPTLPPDVGTHGLAWCML